MCNHQTRRPSLNIYLVAGPLLASAISLPRDAVAQTHAVEEAPAGDLEGGTEEAAPEEAAPEEAAPEEAAPEEAAPEEAAPEEAAPEEAPSDDQATEEQDEKSANNTLYLELFGPGLLYSLNYERGFGGFNLRVGAGGAAWGGSGYLQIPVGFSYTGVGIEKHHLELGATVNTTIAFDTAETRFALTFSPIIGYRLQPLAGGFNFRAGISPFIAGVGEGQFGGGFVPWPYVSFGASF